MGANEEEAVFSALFKDTFLARLHRLTRHFKWYLASVATMSPDAILPMSLLLLVREAHDLTFSSTSRVEARWRVLGLSLDSQKKHWLLDFKLERLDLLAFTGLQLISGRHISELTSFCDSDVRTVQFLVSKAISSSLMPLGLFVV